MSATRDDGFRTSFFMHIYHQTHILIPGVHSVCKPCCWSAAREKDAEISSDLTQGEETLKHSVEIVLYFQDICVQHHNPTFLDHGNKSNWSKTCFVPLANN